MKKRKKKINFKEPQKELVIKLKSDWVKKGLLNKKEYQKKRREFHPDTLTSKGLPEELLEKAKERFIQIQQAYEEIEKQKK